MLYDVIIVGGGPAGLSCALILGRCQRSIIVFDAGNPRNKSSHALHAFITRDGTSPIDFLISAREEVKKYGVVLRHENIVTAHKIPEGFNIITESGLSFQSKKLVLATGVQDRLPLIPNIEKFYSVSVHHCPYCDGWEERNKPMGIYALKRGGAIELSITMKTWSNDITLFTRGVKGFSKEDAKLLTEHGIKLHNGKITGVEGNDGVLDHIIMSNHEKVPIKSLFFSTGNTQHSTLAGQLECECTQKGAINYNNTQETNVPGLYVAGDMAKDMQLIIVAAAEGAKAGVVINKVLNQEKHKALSTITEEPLQS